MPPPRKQAARGRRDPALLTGAGPTPTGDPQVDEELGVDEMTDSHRNPGDIDPDEPNEFLLMAGDIVTCNVTLAVDVIGNGKTDFVGYRATTRVQPGESHDDTYERVVQVVNDGVISAADDAALRWQQYQEMLEESRKEALRVTGGGRQ
jgi:hypothetical protein